MATGLGCPGSHAAPGRDRRRERLLPPLLHERSSSSTSTSPRRCSGSMWVSRAIKDAGHESQGALHSRQAVAEEDPGVRPRRRAASRSRRACTSTSPTSSAQGQAEVCPDVADVFGGPHPTFSPEYLEVGRHRRRSAAARASSRLVELLNKPGGGRDYYETANFWFKTPRPARSSRTASVRWCRTSTSSACPTATHDLRRGRDLPQLGPQGVRHQRGCPMNCSFCFHHAWKKKVYGAKNKEYTRKRSVRPRHRRDQPGAAQSTR